MSSIDDQMSSNWDRTGGYPEGRPLVSVLVPVFRPQESHLRQAIESVLGQTYTHFELLLLDDCPDSPSGAIVRSYTDPRIRYAVNEKNLGISESRNRLIAMAKGEYLAVLDHDDICLPTRLEKQVAYMQGYPEAGVVSSQLLYIPKQTVSSYPEEDSEIKMALMFGCALPHTAAMIRRSVLDKSSVRYEKEYSPAEDYRLWARLFPFTVFHNMQEPLVEYRLHGGNTTSQTWGGNAGRPLENSRAAPFGTAAVLPSGPHQSQDKHPGPAFRAAGAQDCHSSWQNCCLPLRCPPRPSIQKEINHLKTLKGILLDWQLPAADIITSQKDRMANTLRDLPRKQ